MTAKEFLNQEHIIKRTLDQNLTRIELMELYKDYHVDAIVEYIQEMREEGENDLRSILQVITYKFYLENDNNV